MEMSFILIKLIQKINSFPGISQSYVSRYLKGDFHDMSERSRRNIIRWYITFKNNPGAIGKKRLYLQTCCVCTDASI